MKIIREYGVNDKKLRYNLIKGSGTSIADMVGQRVEVAAYALIEVEDQNGDPVETLKVITKEGEIIGTRSKSFISGFCDFLDCMETDQCDEFEVVKVRSKAGRDYITFKA